MGHSGDEQVEHDAEFGRKLDEGKGVGAKEQSVTGMVLEKPDICRASISLFYACVKVSSRS
jgi:hypothetical protein